MTGVSSDSLKNCLQLIPARDSFGGTSLYPVSAPHRPMAPRHRSIRLLVPLIAAALAGCFWHAPPPVNPYQATSDEMNTVLTQLAWFADTIGGVPETLQELCPGVERRACP